MDSLINLLSLVVASIVCNFVFYYRSVSGEMDVEWDEEKQVWIATLHLPKDTDYSIKKKLILKINKK